LKKLSIAALVTKCFYKIQSQWLDISVCTFAERKKNNSKIKTTIGEADASTEIQETNKVTLDPFYFIFFYCIFQQKLLYFPTKVLLTLKYSLSLYFLPRFSATVRIVIAQWEGLCAANCTMIGVVA
jgi:hypothetical protein